MEAPVEHLGGACPARATHHNTLDIDMYMRIATNCLSS